MKTNPFLEPIDKYGDTVIILLGIALMALIIYNAFKLSAKKERIEELLNRRNRIYKKNSETHDIEEEEDKNAAVTPDTIREHETEFNKLCSKQAVFSQMIPIFPLLGILGTVSGLILGLQGGDIEQMKGALGTAMSTTFWGLIWAILLKFADAFPSKIINDVDVMLDDFYRKIDLAEMFERSRKSK